MKFIAIKLLLKLRWWYFHMHPDYVKFTITRDGESYFQNIKTGGIHINYEPI